MKFQPTSFKLQGSRPAAGAAFRHASRLTPHARRGFTLVEIAICLGIIGIALVAIIGILPRGLRTQKNSRQETIVGQDATILFEAVRTGSHGADDLTNYVYAIVNSWSNATTHVHKIYCYTNGLAGRMGFSPSSFTADNWYFALTNGANIVGLLSTPEYTTDLGGPAMPSLLFGGVTNHIAAYVTAMSGVAAERPPQENDILRADAFGYRLHVVNAAIPVDTNLFYLQPLWNNAVAYAAGNRVFYDWTYWHWQPTTNSQPTDVPGASGKWIKDPLFPLEVAANQRELRMLFLWPLLPNGKTGDRSQTFRATLSGLLVADNVTWPLYFYRSQTFSPAH